MLVSRVSLRVRLPQLYWITKSDCRRQSVISFWDRRRAIITTSNYKVCLGRLTQNVTNSCVYFMEGILHYSNPKTLKHVSICMGHLFKKLDRFLTTTAFLLVLILMRKFDKPQWARHKVELWIMFISSVINAKVHLFSGLVVRALLVATTRQLKCNCQRCEKKCNSIQPAPGHNEELTT